jgi:hypothetical protein
MTFACHFRIDLAPRQPRGARLASFGPLVKRPGYAWALLYTNPKAI